MQPGKFSIGRMEDGRTRQLVRERPVLIMGFWILWKKNLCTNYQKGEEETKSRAEGRLHGAASPFDYTVSLHSSCCLPDFKPPTAEKQLETSKFLSIVLSKATLGENQFEVILEAILDCNSRSFLELWFCSD